METSGTRAAWAAYALYAVGLIGAGFFTVVGLFLAHVKAGEWQGTVEGTHFRYLIRTGWWSILWFTLGLLTVWLLVGYAIWFVAAIWYIYRVVRGALRLSDGKPA